MCTYSSVQASAHFCFGIINSANSENVNERGIKCNSYKWEIAGGWALPVSTCPSLQEVFKQAGAAQIGDKEGSAVRNVAMWRFIGLKGAVQRKLQLSSSAATDRHLHFPENWKHVRHYC